MTDQYPPECIHCGSENDDYVLVYGNAICADCCEPDPDLRRDLEIAWGMELNA